MKTKSILTLLSIMTAFSLFAQEDKAFFELNNDSQIDIRATSEGTYKVIKVEVSNFGNETVNVHFPAGGLFVNLDATEQDAIMDSLSESEVGLIARHNLTPDTLDIAKIELKNIYDHWNEIELNSKEVENNYIYLESGPGLKKRRIDEIIKVIEKFYTKIN